MLHLVFNPVAGKGRARRALSDTLAFLDARAVPYQLHSTHRQGHATELAAATPPGAIVVALGGDGTVHEVAKGLLKRGGKNDATGGRTLGVLPLGSGDDFAFSLGIARNDLSSALERLVSGKRCWIDLGMVNGEPFLNGVGTGFDAEVAERVRRSPRYLPGLAGYLYSVMGALAGLACPDALVVVDGAEVHRGPALLIGVQNGPRTGGSFLFAPSATNSDGLLDVVVADRLSRLGALQLLPKVMRGAHVGHPAVELHRGREIQIRWGTPIPGHADGELLQPTLEYLVTVRAGAFPVLR